MKFFTAQEPACAFLILTGIFLAVASQGQKKMDIAYFPPDSPAAMKVKHIVLIYNGQSHKPWPVEDFHPYVAYLNPDGTPRSWFFDTFLVLPLTAKSGNCFYPGFSPTPSDMTDWKWYLEEKLFSGESHLANLNESVEKMQKAMKASRYRAKVILTIPYPDPGQTEFGDIVGSGSAISLAGEAERLKAVSWYLEEIARLWKQAAFSHLEMVGLYWLNEDVSGADRSLLPKVGKMVRDRKKRFFWIPYFGAAGAGDWKELGFDCAVFQPNYFFNPMPASRVEEAARFSREHGMGIELECDRRILTSVEFRMKYKNYLDGGVRHGYMREAVCGYYEGGGALLEAYRSQDPGLHSLYNRTYEFVKGIYKPDHFPGEVSP